MNIDFSKAPEGATHYGKDNECWYKNPNKLSYSLWCGVIWKTYRGEAGAKILVEIPKNKFQNKKTITEDDLVAGLHVVELGQIPFKWLYLRKGLLIEYCETVVSNWCNMKSKPEIVKVYEMEPFASNFHFGHNQHLTLVWEKPAKEEPIEEMTVAQVSAALGKKIKIIEG